ncbi:MAG: PAS domain S-box protein, partial [Nitrosomonas sp.]|nr:PAS domain S-box protein [Nitrosomonas sp.]
MSSSLPFTRTRTPAEHDLQYQNDIYKAITRSLAGAEYDLHGNILNANANFLSLFGYTLEHLAGKHHSLLCLPGTAENEEYAAFWEKLHAGDCVNGEFRRMTAEGGCIYIQASYIPVLDTENKPVKIIQIASDITSEKLATMEMAARMEAVSRSSCLMELSAEGRVLSANERMLQALGCNSADLIGKSERHLLFEEDVQAQEYIDLWIALNEFQPVNLER